MKKINKFDPLVFLTIIVISLYLVMRWLPTGAIIAGGDIGIPNLLPEKQLNDVTSSWWDTHATGTSSPTGYTSIPYYLFLAFLEKIGFSPDITQKLVFFLIIAGGSISMYLLALSFSFNKWTSFIASLFFIFNLTSLSVWQRGVHNPMMMLLLAPLSLLILVNGIKNKSYTSILLINIVCFILSYVFGALGYIFSLWLLWTVYLLVVLISEWKDKETRKFLFSYFVLLVISWLGTNLWWIIPLLDSSKYALGQFTAEELKARGSDVLIALKPYHEPSIILRGLSRYYHYVVKDWGDMYLSPFIIFLSWIPTIIIFSTTLVKSNYKRGSWKYLLALIVLILIISKGVNSPLGWLNILPYDYFHFLAPLRNPYEKVGILLVIPFSLLFGLGAEQISIHLKSRKIGYLNVFVLLAVILSLTILVWPLWFGKLFMSENRKYAVPIPTYYSEANEWLTPRIMEDDTRILHLPLAWGESIDYNWDYTGIEPSQYFFNGSSIGYQVGISSVDSRIRDLLINVHNQETTNIQRAFASLNVGWIVVHNETLYKDRTLEPPDEINRWLNSKPYFLEHLRDVGPLSIWKVRDQYRAGHFYSAGKLFDLSKPKTLYSIKIWDELEALNDGFVTEVQKNQADKLEKYINQTVVFPKNKIKYVPLGTINAEVALKEIAVVNYLPDSSFYPFILLKERLLAFLNQDDVVISCLNLTGKRLLESALLARQNKLEKAKEALENYNKKLDDCMKNSSETFGVYLNNGPVRDFILGILIRERAILDNEFRSAALVEKGLQAKNNLNQYLANLGINPKYEPLEQQPDRDIFILSYSIAKEGNYNIALDNPGSEFIKNPPRITQIDNKAVDFAPIEVTERSIKYPQYRFSEGFHEIQIQTITGENLIQPSLEAKKLKPDLGFTIEEDSSTKEVVFSGQAKDGPVSLELDLPNPDIEQQYEVSFDIYFNQGASPVFSIVHPTDPIDPFTGLVKPASRAELQFNSYPVIWRQATYGYRPPLNAKSAKVVLTLTPWNDCFAQYSVADCQAMGLQNKFDRPTDAKFKNIKVKKLFSADLVLKETNNIITEKIGEADIGWNKTSSILYNLNIENQKTPYIIVFSETFHPLWQIVDSSGKQVDLPHFSINGFSNAWLVDKPLPKDVKVKFVLQDSLSKGQIYTTISWIILLGATIFIKTKFLQASLMSYRKRIK